MLREPRSRGFRRRDNGRVKDWWDKASIVSSFVSSVVLVIVGLLISYSIQQAQLRSSRENTKAQIESASVLARDQQRLQQGQLTGQLLQYLVSKEPAQRGIAIIALRSSVPQTTYDSVVELLAAADGDDSVRKLAIKQLASSTSPTVAGVLGAIANDSTRSQGERLLAADASVELSLRNTAASSATSDSTLILAATGANDYAFVTRSANGEFHGAFTLALLYALHGAADINRDGLMSASEVRSYVANKLRREVPFQTPVAIESGVDDIVLMPLKYKAVHGVFVGTFPQVKGERAWPPLPEAIADARAMSDLFRVQAAQANVQVLLGKEATEAKFLEALRRAAREASERDLFVLYFAGHSAVVKAGGVRWLFADSGDSGGVSTADINKELRIMRARHKVLFVDSSHAAAIAQ
jgi:hypothetical protein